MKTTSITFIALGLITAAAAFDPLSDPRQLPTSSADARQAMLLSGDNQILSNQDRCCNDDFRQALPLSETPIDPAVVTP